MEAEEPTLLIRENAIRQILALCLEHNVDIPDELREELLGGEGVDHSNKSRISTLIEARASELAQLEDDQLIRGIREMWSKVKASPPKIDVRVRDGSYKVINHVDIVEEVLQGRDSQHGSGSQRIQTVANSSPLVKLINRLGYFLLTGDPLARKKAVERVIMEQINLRFQSGKMYLVLGAPRSGKSTLLKMIANTLTKDKTHIAGGEVTINGASPGAGVVWSNLCAYIDQIDRLHPYLTVQETCDFAWKCRSGGSHMRPHFSTDSEVVDYLKKLDEENWMVNTVLQGLGLARVKDTFVGDQQNVRGVSGGEKKRVTLAEMAVVRTPVFCCDEISTGLDAATTYDIVKLFSAVGKLTGSIRIVSLLQPPPETFALFDELILLSGGRVIYAGPVNDVVAHFESLGYRHPERMDVADWLQAIPTKDGAQFLVDNGDEEVGEGARRKHLGADDFKMSFNESEHGKAIVEGLNEPVSSEALALFNDTFAIKYSNPWYVSGKLLVQRELLLWWRDKTQIKARVMQDLIMGIVAGTVFWQASDNAQSVMGILFQSMFFVALGAMLKVPNQFDVRSIFYKQKNAHFFPTWAYVLGRGLAGIPTSIIDSLLYGSIIYWFVGLAHNDGASVANYFVFLLLVLVVSLSAGLMFSVIPAMVRDKTTGQAVMSMGIVFLVLFSGFTVQPDVIPDYWIWAYWINLFAWILRGLAVNEFESGKYDTVGPDGLTQGQETLTFFGFTKNDEPFTYVWVWWGILFALGVGLVSVLVTAVFLGRFRFEAGKSLGEGSGDDDDVVDASANQIEIPFHKVNLTFKDIHYTVKASKSDDKLELLKGVDGVVEAGKMTALMGSSGAGKTTLMDVLAMRKSSGEIVGEVCLNGHPQESNSFRRCTGYVEQFDVQSPQLTIRETVLFSAKLRLDERDPAVTPESTVQFVDQTLHMLELKSIENLQVGDDASGGLSFEQRKRLSIAVELVANPSILFLDEPTSGLDARAAAIVMRGLKRIALTGRAICATIHQPSIAIFNSFDALLLLKRGGEPVFFGELGPESKFLIDYLESYKATPRIQPGENPATWMLTTIGAGSSNAGKQLFDYAGSYAASRLRKKCITRIDEICAQKCDEGKVTFRSKYATGLWTQRKSVMGRVMKVYWRSPSYNLTRLTVSAIVALLFGSIYVSSKVPENESDMNSRVTSIFISTIFLAVSSFNSVLSVFEVERNMFYRHKAALMYDQQALVMAFTLAEIPFILLSSMVFVVIFYFMLGFSTDPDKFFFYYLFFTLYTGAFTFLGQMMVSLVRDSVIAQGLGGLIISFTSMFSGVLIRPNNIPTFWIFAYWLFPGHYALEGLLTSQFHGDTTPIVATTGSAFYYANDCPAFEAANPGMPCVGTAEQWVYVSFGGDFKYSNIPYDIAYLAGLVVGARIITYFALTTLNYAVH